jgi:hypothetical protein
MHDEGLRVVQADCASVILFEQNSDAATDPQPIIFHGL